MKNKKIIYILIMGLLIGGSCLYITHTNSTAYKLKKAGYSKEEIEIINKKLDEKKIEELTEKDYIEEIIPVIKEKYFIQNKLELYLNYLKENKEKEIMDVISIVNAEADKDFYTEIKDVDTSKENLMLVNKYHKLDKDFTFDDIVPIGLQYAYANQSIREEVLENYLSMWHAAKKLDLSLIVNSSYRDYDFQDRLYNRYINNYGKEEADTFSARPGHSEHQTGLALDISAYNSVMENFEDTKEYEWMKDNAHFYGFILRYPEGKEHITGYKFEPWHYRYVGKEIAKEIYDLGITFDEYYELFIK